MGFSARREMSVVLIHVGGRHENGSPHTDLHGVFPSLGVQHPWTYVQSFGKAVFVWCVHGFEPYLKTSKM